MKDYEQTYPVDVATHDPQHLDPLHDPPWEQESGPEPPQAPVQFIEVGLQLPPLISKEGVCHSPAAPEPSPVSP